MEQSLPQYTGARRTVLTPTNIAIALLVFSLLLFVFFERDAYDSYLSAGVDLDAAKTTESQVTAELDTLNAIHTSLDAKTASNTVRDDVARYADALREDTVIRSLFVRNPALSIASIGISGGQVLPSGLSLADITVSFTIKDVIELNKFLEYLTSPQSKKRYVIKSLSFPFDMGNDAPISASLVLGMYYFNDK